MIDWDFRVCGYATPSYSRKIGAPIGALLVETTHKSEASAFVEIEAWKERMKRGEVSHAELIDLRPSWRRDGKTDLTNTRVFLDTTIPWSWCK